MTEVPEFGQGTQRTPREASGLERQYAQLTPRSAEVISIPTEHPNKPFDPQEQTDYPINSWEAQTYLAMKRSVVHINAGVLLHQPVGQPRNMPLSGFGSGFITDTAGTISTDNHVIDDVDPSGIRVFVNDAWHSARIIRQNESNDSAKLQVVPNYAGEQFTPAKIAQPGAHMQGHHLMFGFPTNSNTLFMAVDDAKYPTSKLMRLSDIDQFYPNTGYAPSPGEDPHRVVIQSDMVAGHGFSGGAYVNQNGEIEGRDFASDLLVGGYTYATPVDDLSPSRSAGATRPLPPRFEPHHDVRPPGGAAAGVANGFKF